MMNWLHVWPGGAVLCLPWWWLTLRVLKDGGVSVEVEEPPDVPWPKRLLLLEFMPHHIRFQHWACPKTPQQWRRQLRWWFEDLRGVNG